MAEIFVRIRYFSTSYVRKRNEILADITPDRLCAVFSK